MPLFYLRRLTGSKRTDTANRHLARYLAFVAGAANAGGFLAVRQYTSHMTGIVSAMADNFAVGSLSLVSNGLAAILSFLLGAFLTTLLVRWARSRALESEYALPLIVEAVLLVLFGVTGRVFAGERVLGTVMLLCFTMGLQNAIITKLSGAEIRTTHMTGIVTDMGIELGKLFYWNSSKVDPSVQLVLANRTKLKTLGTMLTMFLVGGVAGAMGFKHIGYASTIPLAGLLLVLAIVPLLDDLRA